jgi:AcrR family transcriptional regulator
MPRVVDPEKQRDAIFAAALEGFARAGYAGLSMRDLAAALQVSTGALYHYFPNKSKLFEGLLTWMARRHVERLLSLLAQDTSADRVALLARFVEQEGAELGQALLLALDHIRAKAQGDEATRGALQVYEGEIAAQLGVDSDTARTVLALVLGLLCRRLLDPGAALGTAAELGVRRIVRLT